MVDKTKKMYEQRKWRGVMKRGEKQTSQLKALCSASCCCLAVCQGVHWREHSWAERIEMRLVCVRVCPKHEAQMLGCWRPIRGSFQVFFTWEKWFFSTCLSPAVMKQQFHSLSSVSALWVKSSNISDYFATLLQALPVQLSCWEVGYHHFMSPAHDITHVFMCVRKCHDLLKWVYMMVIGDGGSVGCWKVTALMKALSFWQNVTV